MGLLSLTDKEKPQNSGQKMLLLAKSYDKCKFHFVVCPEKLIIPFCGFNLKRRTCLHVGTKHGAHYTEIKFRVF